jgi:hypothetical protein
MGDPTGEADRGALRLDFDRRLLLQFRGSAITSDAGLLAYRELDDTLRPTDTGADTLADARTGKWPDMPADRALYDALERATTPSGTPTRPTRSRRAASTRR